MWSTEGHTFPRRQTKLLVPSNIRIIPTVNKIRVYQSNNNTISVVFQRLLYLPCRHVFFSFSKPPIFNTLSFKNLYSCLCFFARVMNFRLCTLTFGRCATLFWDLFDYCSICVILSFWTVDSPSALLYLPNLWLMVAFYGLITLVPIEILMTFFHFCT